MGLNPREILVAAAVVTVTILFSILSCVITTSNAIPANWWPMFVVGTYAMAPFPIIIFGSASRDMDGGNTLTYWSYFTSGWILTTSFGIPCILAHANVIAVGNCFFSLAASFVFYGTILYASVIAARGS